MGNNDAGALIIKNIAMFEAATTLLATDVSEKVFDAIDDLIKRSIGKKTDWEGKYGCYEDETWFAPTKWRTEVGDDWLAWYSWDWIGEGDNWNLSGICGQGKEKTGFKFNVNTALIGCGGRLRPWRQFTSRVLDEYTELRGAGFIYQEHDGTWFSPWKISPENLSECYRDDAIVESLGPVEEALHSLDNVHHIFCKILESAKAHFQENS